MLEQQLEKNRENDEKGRDERKSRRKVMKDLYSLVTRPMSVYFNNVREEPYTLGREEYLTFASCPVNAGNAMDPGSGIFTVPITGRCFTKLYNLCS